MDNTQMVEAIDELKEQKSDIEKRIALIESIDWTKPITEDEWHQICETPLRYSDLLNVLVQNTFPDAKNIMRGTNYICFELRGYKVQIPTFCGRGINIATDWYRDMSYRKSARGPLHSRELLDLKRYFDAKEQKLGWKAEAEARIFGEYYPNDLCLFFGWFFKWKWKKVDRKWFEDMWAEEERKYNHSTQIIEEIEAKNRERLEFVVSNVMPELDKFSTEHYPYFRYDGQHDLAIKKILEKEGLINGNENANS